MCHRLGPEKAGTETRGNVAARPVPPTPGTRAGGPPPGRLFVRRYTVRRRDLFPSATGSDGKRTSTVGSGTVSLFLRLMVPLRCPGVLLRDSHTHRLELDCQGPGPHLRLASCPGTSPRPGGSPRDPWGGPLARTVKDVLGRRPTQGTSLGTFPLPTHQDAPKLKHPFQQW